jgi:abequosyltransferase
MVKLLSICIPTYNRADYLNICINSITSQYQDLPVNQLEVIIIDNDSKDNTKEIVYSYINKGYGIQYIKNETNIGLDGNITKAFDVATGKYVLIFGDDDLWFKGKIKKLLNILSDTEAGIVYIKPISFSIYDEDLDVGNDTNKVYVFNKPNDFLFKIDIMVTFTSSNVINKHLVVKQRDFKLNQFLGTDLNLLNWIYTAALAAPINILTQDFYIASQSDNNSGYKFFKVFGESFNNIMNYFKTKGLQQNVIKHVNYILTTIFFPVYLKKISNDDWSYDDRKEEVYSFLQRYRNKDILCRLFLIETYKNGTNYN